MDGVPRAKVNQLSCACRDANAMAGHTSKCETGNLFQTNNATNHDGPVVRATVIRKNPGNVVEWEAKSSRPVPTYTVP
jgi:hypothetical protein